MKKLQQISLAMMFFSLMFYSQTITAQHHETNMKQSHEHKKQSHEHEGMSGNIPNLTEQQKAQIKTLRIAHMKKTQELRNLINVKDAELKVLQTADKLDLNAINKKIDEKAALETKIEKERAAIRQKIRALLTDEQKVIFDARLQKRNHHKVSKEEMKAYKTID